MLYFLYLKLNTKYFRFNRREKQRTKRMNKKRIFCVNKLLEMHRIGLRSKTLL